MIKGLFNIGLAFVGMVVLLAVWVTEPLVADLFWLLLLCFLGWIGLQQFFTALGAKLNARDTTKNNSNTIEG